MSYGVKYISRFQSEYVEFEYEVKISERGYTGTAMQRNLGGAPVLIKDSNGVISGTSLELLIETAHDGDLREFYTEDNKKFRVDVFRDGLLYWTGFIVTEKYAESMVPHADIAITVTDGLGLLKKVDYTLTGKCPVLEIIKYCTDKTGLTLGYQVNAGVECLTSQSVGILKEAVVNAEIYAGEDCYKVLSSVLENFGFIITQAHARWYLRPETAGSIRFYYDSLLNKEDIKNPWDYANMRIGDLNSPNSKLFPVGSLSLEVEPGKKDLSVIQEYRSYPSYFSNYNFSENTAWNGEGTYVTLQDTPCRFIKGIYGNFNKKFSQEVTVDKCLRSFRFEIKYAVLTSDIGAEHKIDVYVQNIRNESYIATLGQNGWTQQNKHLTLKVDNLTSAFGGEVKWNTFTMYTNALPEPGKLKIELSCVSGPSSASDLAGVYYSEIIAINEIPAEIENKRTLNPEASEDAEEKRLVAGSCYNVPNREKIVASAIEIRNSLDPVFYLVSGPNIHIQGMLHSVMSAYYGNVFLKARKVLKGTVMHKLKSDKYYDFGFDHILIYEYDNCQYVIRDASYNLLTDEIDCTLVEVVKPISLPAIQILSGRSVNTEKSVARRISENVMRTYGGTSEEAKMIRELGAASEAEITDDTLLEIDYSLSSQSKKTTLSMLRKYLVGNWFYEENGELHCRLNFTGDLDVSAFGGSGGTGGPGVDLIDNLTSIRTDAALTANMGRYLKNLIDGKASDWNSITGKPSAFPPSAHTHAWADITGSLDLDSIYIKKSGDTMLGNLAIGTNIIMGHGGNGLLFSDGANSNIGMRTGITKLRSGATNLVHLKNESGSDRGYTIWDASNSNLTSVNWNVNQLSFPESQFNVNAPARSTLNPMSLKLWDVYNNNIGLTQTYATILEIYGKSGHWDHQLAFEGYKGSLYHRGSTWNETTFEEWRKIWDSSNSNLSSVDWKANRLTANSLTVGTIAADNNSYSIIPSATNPYLRLSRDSLHYYLQVTATGVTLGLSGPKGLTITPAGRGNFTDGLSVGYNNTSYTLSTYSFISDKWVRTLGTTGWFSETYGGGIYMSDTDYVRIYNNKRFYVGNNSAYSVYTNGGFTRDGYAGASWFNGHGALNVAITNNGAQTPLLVAFRAGQSPAVTGASRLFSLELLNTGTTMYWAFGGVKRFDFTSSGNFTATGEVSAYTASDARLKYNIRELDGLSHINRLRPVAFYWNDKARELAGDNRQHGYGLIAQELQNVLPDCVGNIYNSEFLGIRYEKLIPFLIAAVKQLSEEVKQLKQA